MPQQWITDKAQIEAVLAECLVGSLATINPDGSPYVVCVHYLYRQDRIYFHCALSGQKLDNIDREPRVCFEVHVMEQIKTADCATQFATRYRSVIANGQAHVLDDPATKHEVLMQLTHKYAGGHVFAPPSEQDVEHTAVVEIQIDAMTGKRNVDAS